MPAHTDTSSRFSRQHCSDSYQILISCVDWSLLWVNGSFLRVRRSLLRQGSKSPKTRCQLTLILVADFPANTVVTPIKYWFCVIFSIIKYVFTHIFSEWCGEHPHGLRAYIYILGNGKYVRKYIYFIFTVRACVCVYTHTYLMTLSIVWANGLDASRRVCVCVCVCVCVWMCMCVCVCVCW